MYFKDISYLELYQPFCSAKQNHVCNFGRGQYEKHIFEFISNLAQWFRRSSRVKYLLFGAMADLLFSGSDHSCNFERGHQGVHSFEVMWNLDQRFRRRCRLKIFLILSSVGPFVQWSGPLVQLLVKGYMRNNSTLLWIYFEFGPVVQDVV